MARRKLGAALLLAASLIGGLCLSTAANAQSTRVFELRTYTTNDGKLNNLLNRFRYHTVRIFARHDMVSIGYWIPKDTPNTLIYILAHPSREAATRAHNMVKRAMRCHDFGSGLEESPAA